MSSLQPVFTGALQRMQQDHSDLEMARPTDVTTREMQRLAKLAIDVSVTEGAVTAKSIPQSGYVLTSDSVSALKLRGVATILANLSNHPVSYSLSSGEMQSCDPLGVPVFFGDPQSHMGARRGVARAIFGTLKRDPESEVGLKNRLSTTDVQQTSINDHCTFKVTTRQSELRELVIENDISLLSHQPFLDIIEQLRKSHAPFILRFEPSFASVCDAARELFGTRAAWMLEPRGKSYHLSVIQTPELQTDFVKKIARCLGRRTNATVSVEYIASDCLILLSPTASTTGAPPSCTPTRYLPCSMSRPKSGSNIATCEIPFQECHERVLHFIRDHISSESAFVRVVPRKTQSAMSEDNFLLAVDELTTRLKLPAAERSYTNNVSFSQELTVKLAPVTAVADPTTLALALSYIDAMRQLCTTSPRLPRHASRTELFTLFSKIVGHECDWDFVSRDGQMFIRTRTPERFSSDVLDLAKIIFGRTITLLREPEEERGEFLLSPSEVHAHPDTRQFFPEELQNIFPRGFGSPPIIVQQGNRLLVYSMTKNLPPAYINTVTPELYGISIPVVLRTDMRATLVQDVETLRDIVVRSLPAGTYLRGIIDAPQVFTLEISRCGGDQSHIDEVLEQITACCAKKLSISWVTPTPEFRSVMSRLATETEKRFFALTIDSSNTVADSTTLTDTFLELFGCGYEITQKPPKIVTPDSFMLRALTSIDCFAIDKKDTRISEDAFSVEQLPEGGYRFGIHIIAGPLLIPFGSPADIVARRVGANCTLEFGGKEHPFRLFSRPLRDLFNLAANEASPAFSLTFDTDAEYTIKADSYELSLALIKSRKPVSFEQADRVLEHPSPGGTNDFEVALSHVQKLFQTQDSRSSSFAGSKAPCKSKQLTHRLLMAFSDYAHKRLTENGISLPPPTLSGPDMDIVKFTGPARNFLSLLAQRQLERFICQQESFSSAMIDDHFARAGTSAEDTTSYRLICAAEHLRETHPTAAIVLLANGDCRAEERIALSSRPPG